MVQKNGHICHMVIWQREQTRKCLHLASIHTAGFIVITINSLAHPWPEDTNPPHAHVHHMTYSPTYGILHLIAVLNFWKKLQQCLAMMSGIHNQKSSFNKKKIMLN